MPVTWTCALPSPSVDRPDVPAPFDARPSVRLPVCTPALDTSKTYDKVSIFGDFNVKAAADETFYFDDITWVP